MSDPVVSVVIPAHNAAATIIDQLNAVAIAAGAIPAEVIVVDNRSTDDTVAVVERWIDEHGVDARVVPAPDRAGEPHARNVGVAAARAELICFCDADDAVHPGWLAAMVDGLREATYVTGPLDLDALNEPWLVEIRGRATTEHAAVLWDTVPYAHGCNMGFRRAALLAVGGFDEQYTTACDLDIAVRMWEAGHELHFVPDAVVSYRLRRTLADTYRQGVSYGRWRVPIRHRVAALSAALPSPVRPSLRRAAWLARRAVPAVFSRRARVAWVWVASQLWGEVRGGVEFR